MSFSILGNNLKEPVSNSDLLKEDRQFPLQGYKEQEDDDDDDELTRRRTDRGKKTLSAYDETSCETTTVRCCGSCCCVLLGVVLLSWIVNSIHITTITDIPSFARSAIWVSIAHHTDSWKEYQGNLPPPPPEFGDGAGNFR